MKLKGAMVRLATHTLNSLDVEPPKMPDSKPREFARSPKPMYNSRLRPFVMQSFGVQRVVT